MQVLITGGAGFIGSHLADRLLAAGHEVRVLDSLDAQVHAGGRRPDYLDGNVQLEAGDVRDAETVAKALAGVEAVVNLAAVVGVGQSMYEIARYTSANSLGCAVLLEEIVKRRDTISKVIVASSMSIYGEGQYADPTTGKHDVAPGLRPRSQLERREWEILGDDGASLTPVPTEETKPVLPTSVYAVTKRDQEELTLAVGAAYGIPSVALRFFNVYGPRQSLSNPYTGVAAIFASRLMNGRPPIVFEDGRQTRDFIHVTDIARCCELALSLGTADGRALNVGTGIPTSVLDVADVLGRGLGAHFEPEITGEYRAGDIRHCYASTQRAEKLLGFRAEVEFERGMQELLSWLGEQEAVDRADAAHAALRERGLTG